MPNITDEHVENYLYAMLPPREPVLQEMERQAKERDIPIVGPAVGRLFYQYATADQGEDCLRDGLGHRLLHHLVGQERWAKAARSTTPTAAARTPTKPGATSQQAGVADRIEVHVGDALELLSERKEQFDILFCDVDKHDYPRVFNMAAARVRKGGLYITDNTLWSGQVAYAAGNPESAEAASRTNRPKAWSS